MTQAALTRELETILSFLHQQRAHALEILEGLDEEALRRPVLPSGWSCLGMVGHLADLECFWFRRVVAGDQTAAADLPASDDPWQIAPEVPAAAVFAAYRHEIERADAIIAATPLAAPPAWWPDFFGDWRLHDFCEIVFHVMTETANHAGHLDAARELIDGKLWLVL